MRVVLICSWVLGLAVSFVLPFLSLWGTREVGMSLGWFGVFMTSIALLNIVISTLLARRSDSHYSRRALLLWGSAAGTLGYLGYGFVRSPWLLLLIGGVVLGIASVVFAQLFAYARELLSSSDIPSSDVPLYMNAIRMAFALAWTVGPAIAAFTLQQFSFLGLFGVAAALYGALFVIVWRWIEETPPTSEQVRAARAGLRGVFTRPGVLRWFIAFVLMLAAHTIAMNNMSLLVLRVLGGTESQVGVIFSLAPLFELPFMLYFGLLATRIRTEKLIQLAMLLAAIYYFGLSRASAPQQIYPLQFLSAAVVAVTSGVAITFFQNKLPDQLGSATNLYSNASRVGSTSGYLLFGSLSHRFGHRGAAFACSLLAVCALLITLLPERRRESATG